MPNNTSKSSFSLAQLGALRRHFWQPPRAHGDVIEGREVSFLELFYDLVYVVVISQAAHHLAGHLSWPGVGQFAIVFGMIWFAWINGAVYHELHARSDGRTRFYVFAQMSVLVLLAVFTGEATAADGTAFALVYSAYLFLLGWLWYAVRRQDAPALRPATTPYLVGVLGSAVVVAASALLPREPRLLVWAVLVAVWLVGLAALQGRRRAPAVGSASDSESMIERFDLFTIIVLGEVVVGAVSGIADASRTPIAIVTGILGLGIGFAYWWTYFDLVGGRKLASDRGAVARWLIGHFFVTATIAATGGVIVSMTRHSSVVHSAMPAMLLSLSVTVGILALILIASSLADWRSLAPVYRPATVALVVAAAISIVIGLIGPQPWLQLLLLTLLLGAVWVFSMVVWFSFTRR